jgi:soluble lytic murein transglycosylase-like protein
MMLSPRIRRIFNTVAVAALTFCPAAHAAEHITLTNGFEFDCARRETAGGRVRLYLTAGNNALGFLEVASTAILRAETLAEPITPTVVPNTAASAANVPELLAQAGQRHRIDADLLASVVQAESGGHARAVSRTGARGLMQLMPATAAQLGVADSFQPSQNIAGGAAYLDQLLTLYHDNIAVALAAYNAGPAAVNRYHGIPPYRETQLYVARVITEFNRRKQLAVHTP